MFDWARERAARRTADQTHGVRLPFADRAEAGRLLGRALAAGPPLADPIVLAIPRGGVPVAAAIADVLGIRFDVLVAHKLGAPDNPELAIGAVAADGTVLVEPWARDIVGRDIAYVEAEAAAEVDRARLRERALRQGRPRLDLAGLTAILVDDGIATGATMHVGILAARAAGASRVICAIPVGAAESVAMLEQVADAVVVLATPSPFRAVGEWYERFDQVADADVERLLRATTPKSPDEESGPRGPVGA
jgi:predicted phosphoribosyltransferase